MTFAYFDRIYEILKDVETKEANNITQATNLITSTILTKHSIYIFGASHAGILTEELFYRAGGMIVINPIFAKDLMLDTKPITHTSKMERLEGYGTLLATDINFQKDDVLILHSVSGRNPVTIELAIEARNKGVKVITITNLAYSQSVTSRHSSHKKLYEVSDIVIDNHGDIGDACVPIPEHHQKVGPSSTVIGATILNTIISESTKLLIDKGIQHPPIFYSANLDGGDELNKQLIQEYKSIIKYQY